MKYAAFSSIALLSLTGCSAVGYMLNPFQEAPAKEAYYGEANDHALNETGEKATKARDSLEKIGEFRKTSEPAPYNPVMNPAIVRLMWIPDHLNRHGDLVPAHFYYLKVLNDRWALQDAFELDGQLQNPRGKGGGSSNLPYVNKEDGSIAQ